MTSEQPPAPPPAFAPAPKAGKPVRVAVAWPFARLEAAGVVVTRELTEVSEQALAEIRKLAALNGARLIEKGPSDAE